jgi:hypothetical protein
MQTTKLNVAFGGLLMLENIKITANNINSTNNNLNRVRVPEKPEVLSSFDILDPNIVNKAIKPEQAALNNQNQSGNIAPNPNSVFVKFLQSLDLAPTLIENMRKLLLSKQFVNSNIKTNPLMSLFFEEFVKDIDMDNEQMLDFIKFQHNNYTKFSGEFFTFVRNALKANPSDDFKNVVANFLKSYDCFLSADDSTKAIENILKQITDNMPEILKESFESMANKMILNDPENNAAKNLDLLKSEIIPYLGKYIAKTNDFGIIRDYISVLVHNIVRLEKGLQDNFLDSADVLLEYMKYSFNLSDDNVSELKQALINTFRGSNDIKSNSLDFMFKMIDSGINDDKNHVNKTTFENIQESLLTSNNVQVPLVHIFLPVNYAGVFMFSELWISKEIYDDSVKDGSKKSSKDVENADLYKIFLNFDIENIGYFETVILYKNDKISLDISIPNFLKNFSSKIKTDISNIVKKNNISVTDIYVSECTKQRKFNEVFGTKFIKERGINVIA